MDKGEKEMKEEINKNRKQQFSWRFFFLDMGFFFFFTII